MLVPRSRRSAPPCPAVDGLRPLGGLPPWAQPPSVLVTTAPGVLLSCSGCCCLSEIEAKYDKKMKMLRDELDLRRKTEIHEEERPDHHTDAATRGSLHRHQELLQRHHPQQPGSHQLPQGAAGAACRLEPTPLLVDTPGLQRPLIETHML